MRNFLRRLFAKPVLPPDPFGYPPRESEPMSAARQSEEAGVIGVAAASVANIQRQ